MFSIHSSKEKHINVKGRLWASRFKLNRNGIVLFKSSVNQGMKFRETKTWTSLLNFIFEVLKYSLISTRTSMGGRMTDYITKFIWMQSWEVSLLVCCVFMVYYFFFLWYFVLSSCHARKRAQVSHPRMHRKRAREQQPQHSQEVIVMGCYSFTVQRNVREIFQRKIRN